MARRDGKSADAFRTISEVADDVDVPQHVLRFWETKFAQIKPLKRGGGRRYYRPEDVDLIRRVRNWLYDDGYTIKGVQKLLREGAGTADAGEEPAEAEPPAAEPAPSEPALSEPARSEQSVSEQSVSEQAMSDPGLQGFDDTVSPDTVLHVLETGGRGGLDEGSRAAIGTAIRELEQLRDRLRSPDG